MLHAYRLRNLRSCSKKLLQDACAQPRVVQEMRSPTKGPRCRSPLIYMEPMSGFAYAAASTACRRLHAHARSPAHAHAFARPRGLTASNPGTLAEEKRAPLLGPSHIHGANERIRTADLRITSALLYQLSHVGICNAGALRSPTVVYLTWYWRSSQASTNLFYLPSCVMTPRITPCVDAAAFLPASSASSWLLSIIPALLVTSVMPRTSMPNALAMMASHTVEQPT